MKAMRRFFLGITGVLSLIFLLQILLSGVVRAQEEEPVKPKAGMSDGSWYDEVGLERGFSDTSGFTSFLGAEEASFESLLAPASSACQMAVLRGLGWSVERVRGSSRFVYSSGNPCDNSSLEESRSLGELRVRVPEVSDEATLQAALRRVLSSPASVCAYKFHVGAAARRAARKLQLNRGFYFYSGGWPFVAISNAVRWWGSCVSRGYYACVFPRRSNSDAMEDFVSGQIGTECALGLQAAEYATIRELFGDVGFNSSFQMKEVVIAPWTVLHGTGSATWGRLTNADTEVDRNAAATARVGSQAFLGFSGYIGNVFGEAYLDHPIDRGENFLTTFVSLSAGAELAARGGFGVYNAWNRRLYELGRVLPPSIERLALTNQDPNLLPITANQRLAFAEMQRILRNPVYSEYQVFVHPLGTMTLGQHIVRLLERNPRTPYTFELYPSRMGRGIYARYVNWMLSRCGN
jgi:hypothetical protein